MATAKTCSVCEKSFELKFRYQLVEDGAGVRSWLHPGDMRSGVGEGR